MIVLRNAVKLNKMMDMGRKEKLQIAGIAVMMMIGAFLETLGVSMVVPLVLVVTEPGAMGQNPFIKNVCTLCSIRTEKALVLIIIACLAGIFIIKGFFLLAEYQIQFRFVHNSKINMQRRLLQIYLNRPYEYFLGTNFSEILQNLTENVNAAFTIFSHILGFFTEVAVSLFLAAAIFLIDPIMTILVSIVLLFLILFLQKVIRSILEQEGRKKQKYGAQTSKWLLQAIHGIKEIKILGKENYFLENYIRTGKRQLEAERKNIILNRTPRVLIESFSVSAMLIGIAVMVLAGNDVGRLLPALSAFAMAAARLMPSAHRVVTYMNELAYYEPALDKLLDNFEALEEGEEKNREKAEELVSLEKIGDIDKLKCVEKMQKPGAESRKKPGDSKQLAEPSASAQLRLNAHRQPFMKKEIVLTGISYRYPNMRTNVLTNAEMRIPVGKSVGIAGVSGAGKTTVADILLGLLKPQAGRILADGIDISGICHEQLFHAGYIPQMIFMLDDTIRNNIAFGIPEPETDDDRVWEALEEAQLADFVRSLPEKLDTEIGERGVRLSGGQRQRIGVARALYTDPDILIFDEATSALDIGTEAALMEAIGHQHGKKTLIIIAHRLQTIEMCDMVYRVENGEIRQYP